MRFQLAVGGVLPDDPAVAEAVRTYLRRIRGCLDGESAALQVLVSPSYTAAAWLPLCAGGDTSFFGFYRSGESPFPDEPACCVRVDTPVRAVVGEAMCDRADLVLAVWDEDASQADGACWELIQLAHRERTPCLWISSKTGAAYWSQDSFYAPFDGRALEKLCAVYSAPAPEPLPDTERSIPLLRLGDWLRRRFLGKFRALQPETKAEEDRILRDDFALDGADTGSEAVRRDILDRYQRFDQAAIALNSQYQAILYWRAILPFIATVFLAVGFYAETLLSVTGLPQHLRACIAGTGFLIHGLLNLYVYRLSRNSAVQDKHHAFLQNRYVAEILRVLIHFVPFGIYTDLHGMCGGSEQTRADIQHLTLGQEPPLRQVDGRAAHRALGHIHEMLSDQIAYHEASAGRFRRILERLDRWYKIIFAAGFVMVILRAFLQFYLSFSPLPGTVPGATTSWNSYASSTANMIALMLPAWASYFSSKISLCNFRFNYDNHTHAALRLSRLLGHVDRLLAMGERVPVDVLGSLSEDLAQAMIVEDTLLWERKFESSSVTRL